jgi:putative oxidoreductase
VNGKARARIRQSFQTGFLFTHEGMMKRFPTYPDVALLVIRLILGLSFWLHGMMKYNMGLSNVGESFGKMGIPMGSLAGPAITLLEMIGAIALVLGIGTRIFAALLVCDMLGAIAFVHGKNGYTGQGGMELVALLGTLALTLVLCGAGRFSLDSRIGRRDNP